jgi:hypothetical protein
MSRYDFASLSSRDFEELARDLLQAEWNVALESFRPGKDSGIDLRYMPAHGGGATIVQCKHFAVSGFSKLVANLRDVELPKVERLNPSRYVVVTSVKLTPGNKDEIAAALRLFVNTPQDILGAGDLEGLLSRHPGVERANFKLWLTSTSVMERVQHIGRCPYRSMPFASYSASGWLQPDSLEFPPSPLLVMTSCRLSLPGHHLYYLLAVAATNPSFTVAARLTTRGACLATGFSSVQDTELRTRISLRFASAAARQRPPLVQSADRSLLRLLTRARKTARD